MGREIRRVPPNWEHPKEQKGGYEYGRFVVKEVYIPLFDSSFEFQAGDWLKDLQKWLDGKYYEKPEDNDYDRTIRAFCEFHGNFPNPEYYRPEWTEEECTAYQIYETVSEGTPVSPVFQSEQEMIDWLIGQGHNLNSVTEFVKSGWAPSMVMRVRPDGSGEYASGIDSFDLK